jgi:ubiquinone/menaquinone biosynthesis C-methylase UbiE
MIGCADGLNALGLLLSFESGAHLTEQRQMRVIGVDIAETPLEEFRARVDEFHLSERVSVHHTTTTDGSSLDTLLADNSLDMALLAFVLHYVDESEQDALISAVARKLRANGGGVVVGTIDDPTRFGFTTTLDKLERLLSRHSLHIERRVTLRGDAFLPLHLGGPTKPARAPHHEMSFTWLFATNVMPQSSSSSDAV